VDEHDVLALKVHALARKPPPANTHEQSTAELQINDRVNQLRNQQPGEHQRDRFRHGQRLPPPPHR
jgi:hypothetical protein